MRRASREFCRHAHRLRPAVPCATAFGIVGSVSQCELRQEARTSLVVTVRDPIDKLDSQEISANTRLLSRLRSKFRKWWRSLGAQLRAVRRALYLSLLFSPVAATWPVARAIKERYPDLQEKWWDYVLWTIQKASPTVIKFVQWASSRRDIFDEEFCNRFQEVQANSTQHSMEVTERILAEEYGENWRDVIEIEGDVVGSGCMAQVYAGFLKKKGDRRHVALKVMHPGMRESVAADLDIMSSFLKMFSETELYRTLNLATVFQDFKYVMLNQVDMRNEGRNLQRLRENFEDNKKIIFPEPVMTHTTDRVLVEEFIDAEPVLKYIEAGVDSRVRKHLAELGLHALLKMVMFHNFVHADLHPGNILVRQPQSPEEDELPDLVFLDAGIVTEYGAATHDHIKDVFLSMLTHHGEECAEELIANSERNEGPTPVGIKKFIEEVTFLVEDRSDGKVTGQVAKYLSGLFKLCCNHQVMLDASFMTVAMAVEVMEGIAKSLDPEIDVVEKARAIVLIDEMKDRMEKLFGRGGDSESPSA